MDVKVCYWRSSLSHLTSIISSQKRWSNQHHTKPVMENLDYFLRKLKKGKITQAEFLLFYRGRIENIPTGNIINWLGLCTAKDTKDLLWVKTTQKVIGSHLRSVSDICEVRCLNRAKRIPKTNTRHSHSLFPLLPSGKWYRSISCQQTTKQLISSGWNSFYFYAFLYAFIYVNV